jgi:hypothetical protein
MTSPVIYVLIGDTESIVSTIDDEDDVEEDEDTSSMISSVYDVSNNKDF